LYIDMMQSVLGNSSKVLIDQKGGNNMMYLPLDRMMERARSESAAAGAQPEPIRPVVPEPAQPVEPARTSRDTRDLRNSR
jgi:modulator of FtsH protease HflK